MFIARVKNNPAGYSINIDGTATNLSRIDEWKLCRGNNTDIAIARRNDEAISNRDCFAEFILSKANVLAMTDSCQLIYDVYDSAGTIRRS